ncbi:uncharacterized protein LOC106137275 isoform X2 [Amyelois transitella]|uniref:uncharacterized protein LOC106137275 isoform X2 n=1 Tax=Amyelois transitella TaxID=680683 RepID=UPI00299040A0|nr:uncharacterized protein LOC106137275 isoform X2 [Amyelois transitella]
MDSSTQDDTEKTVSPNLKQKSRGIKRKRKSSGSSSSDIDDVLPENTLEVENNLHMSAVKNNLDDTSVKKILKKVVTNTHVLALVKLQEEEEMGTSEDGGHIPKLTRSKVKELKKVSSGKPAWNLDNLELTPIKHIPVKTRPEVKALIAQELPEDEDDDEYQPTHDDSDDDQTLESCSDLDSQPRTPATPNNQQPVNSPRVVKDGPFVVPQETPVKRKPESDKEEATIALRTRSKLSLSETPIEHIESSFVPPDDIPGPVDDLWNQFLAECLDPGQAARHEDDDEADPEYNVAADPDAHDEDEEALENNIIKISRKELNDLVTELFSVMPEDVEDCLTEKMVENVLGVGNKTANQWEGKNEPQSDEDTTYTSKRISDRIKFEGRDNAGYSIGKMEPPDEEEERHYLEIGALPKEIPIKPAKDKDSTGSKVDQLISETVESDMTYPPNTIANMVKVVDGQASNVVNIVVGQQATRVQIPSAPLPLQKMQPRNRRASPRSKSKITRVEVHMGSGLCILPEQVIILQQQLRQHIQLAASNFLQLFVHPLNYGFGPTYKGFIESLVQMADKTPNSVVEVCNLRPAMELVSGWEAKVSQTTPENTEYIQYIQDDCQKWANYMARNNYYLGDFHDMFKKAIAESPVFLYPYLLPPRPYHNRQRRSNYLMSEDELIALGLHQFRQYVMDNPKMYKKSKHKDTTRWWLNAALELICKHMLPFFTIRMLMSHLANVKKYHDQENPINRFFETYEVLPLEHQILPFNPNMTLEHHPVEEMPRVWLWYLAKINPIFRKFYSRYKNQAGAPPAGIPLHVNLDPNAPVMEVPTPLEFTKKITVRKLKPKDPNAAPNDNKQDNLDSEAPKDNVQTPGVSTNVVPLQPIVGEGIYTIDNTGITNQLVPLIIQMNSAEVSSSVVTNTAPVSEQITSNDGTVAKNITSTIQPNTTILEPTTTTSPIEPVTIDLTENSKHTETKTDNNIRTATVTVNCNNSPITSTRSSIPHSISSTDQQYPCNKALPKKPNHCQCCVLLRKVCKIQTKITDYFNRDRRKTRCFCKNITYPRITKKLILLVNTFKDPYKTAMETFSANLDEAKKLARRRMSVRNLENKLMAKKHQIEESRSTDVEDFSYVIGYKMKLMARLGTNISLKAKVHSIFSNFNTNTDDPLTLAKSLNETLTGIHSSLFRDFLPFLTKDQAAKIGRFKDYFAVVCVADLVQMVQEEVVRVRSRRTVLQRMYKVLTATGEPAACEICARLLPTFNDYPHLAERVFKMFPHHLAVIEERADKNTGPVPPPPASNNSTQPVPVIPHVIAPSRADINTDPVAPVSNNTTQHVPVIPYVIAPSSADQYITVLTLPSQPQSLTLGVPNDNTPRAEINSDQSCRNSQTSQVTNATQELAPRSQIPNATDTVLSKGHTSCSDDEENMPLHRVKAALYHERSQGKCDNAVSDPCQDKFGDSGNDSDATLCSDKSCKREHIEESGCEQEMDTCEQEMDTCEQERVTSANEERICEEKTDAPLCADKTCEQDLDATLCEDATCEQEQMDVTLKGDDQMQVDYEADHSSSGEEEENASDTESRLVIKEEPEEEMGDVYGIGSNIQIFISDVKSEQESDDYSAVENPEAAKYEESHRDAIESDDGTVKSETAEWQRDEDKVILQVIRDNIVMGNFGDKTIVELLEEKQMIHLLSESLTHKSPNEIRNRIIYLIKMLAINNN